jgi:uncharacterized membrane protein YcaP (DUF421 family)
MDPLRIIVRVLFAYVFAVAVVRASGKATIQQADVCSFVLAVVIGDMFDDFFWSEVPAAQFVIGVGTLVLTHVAVRLNAFHAGSRRWRAGRRA